jgi:hypothetical protein
MSRKFVTAIESDGCLFYGDGFTLSERTARVVNVHGACGYLWLTIVSVRRRVSGKLSAWHGHHGSGAMGRSA